jgi:voltage-gated potassium channel Kch
LNSSAGSEIPVKYIIAFALLVAFVFVFAVFFIESRGVGLYSAVYFTTSALFDAVGVSGGSMVSAAIPVYSRAFPAFIVILFMLGIIKIAVIGFVLAGIVDLITNIRLRERFVFFRIRKLKNGILVCGFNSLSEDLCQILRAKGMPFIVIEKNESRAEAADLLNYNTIRGDFGDDAVLREAAISQARGVIMASEDDFENLLGVVAAHYLNRKVKIITRARDEDSVSKMQRANATMCVIPEVLAGLEMGNKILQKVR